MDRICIITDTLENHRLLTPLMDIFRQQEAVRLTVLATGRHQTADVALNFASLETHGRIEDQFLDVSLFPEQPCADLEQRAYAAALQDIDPEIVVLAGNSFSAFSAAVAAFLNDIPVAHIDGGMSDSGVFDDAYSLGIAKIATLHFTSTAGNRQRLIRLGKSPGQVFNVGSLQAARLVAETIQDREIFCRRANLGPEDEFILVSMVPDRAIGSRNEGLIRAVAQALSDPRFTPFKLLCISPGPKGFGRIMERQLTLLSSRFPGRLVFLRDASLMPSALTHCRSVIGNTDSCVADAGILRAPSVLVGNRITEPENPGHIIPVPDDPEKIAGGLARALAPEFKIGLMYLKTPFEKPYTARRISAVLQNRTRVDAPTKNR